MAQVSRKSKAFVGPLAWLWLLAFCAGTGIAALIWLTTLPPLPECKNAGTLSLDADKLFCVEQTIRSDDAESLIAGLDLVKGWNTEHPLYSRSRDLLEKWSNALLELARMKAIEADLKGAIALAQKIPPSSPTYKDAKAAITTWQKDLSAGQAKVNAVHAAIEARNWALAAQRIRELSKMDSDYWVQQIDRLRQQISTEEIAAQQLQKARNLVKSSPRNLEALGRAIGLAEQINPDTVTAKAAKADTDRWMQALYGMVAGQLSPRTDLRDATAAVQKLPRGIPAPDVKDILWFSRAQSLVTDPLPRGPLYQQLWQLWLTYSQVSQIHPNSPLYVQAKAALPKLQTQIQDVTQLNAASALASLWQIPTLQAAIGIAQGIAPDRPRRIYAQTLMTMWKKDIERVQDSPNLVLARQLAATGSPAALRQAIAYAGQVPPGRPLYGDARGAIAQWNRQIQLVEDEPILKQAQAFASQQKLPEAIQVASRIRPGRVLYKEAQTAISNWVAEIQIAEDQPLLNRAYDLAAQGNLTTAINLANRINPGRALYGQAQSAIATWTAQQEKSRQPKPDENFTPEETNSEVNASPSPDSLVTPSPSITADPSVAPVPQPRVLPTVAPAVLPNSSPAVNQPLAPTQTSLPQTTPTQNYPVETQEVLPTP